MIDTNVHLKYHEDRIDGTQVIARKRKVAMDRRTDANPSSDNITNSLIELTDPINLVFDTKIILLSAKFCGDMTFQ